MTGNEIGTSPGRGRTVVPRADAERLLSKIARRYLKLPERAQMNAGPARCPACGATAVIWGCDPAVDRPLTDIHPAVWSESALMADSFVCTTCHAGWIEPDSPEPITWVRPYWIETS